MSGVKKILQISFALMVLVLVLVGCQDQVRIERRTKDSKDKSVKLPPCKACTVLVDSFQLGMDRTSREKHGGGDAEWERNKLKKYKKSEIRLVEIQEGLCQEVFRGQEQCIDNASEYEEMLEDWFLNKQFKHPNLREWLCVDELKVCCPEGYYGPDCKECSICYGNGKCKGSGTRKGNGKCACDPGYAGENCNSCADNYYEAFRDDSKLLCSACHKSCGDGCTGAGPRACRKCLPGWHMHVDHGCLDVNECVDNPNICKHNQFCVNDAGSYSCLECDRSCDGCDGDGPDMCTKCAAGFKVIDGKCEDVSEEKRDNYVTLTRFLTYFGLCFATCVIFQSSTYIAYIVGAAVAIYIAASEYWLNTTPQAGTKPQFDTKQLEEMIMKNL